MQNKTAIEWLEIARANGETWVDKALNNIEAQPDFSDKDSYPSVQSVIEEGFDWEETGEGCEYWDVIHSGL